MRHIDAVAELLKNPDQSQTILCFMGLFEWYTMREVQILIYLMIHKQATRKELESLLPNSVSGKGQSISTTICRLRHKLPPNITIPSAKRSKVYRYVEHQEG